MNKNLKPVVAVAGVSLAFSLAFTGLVGCNNGKGDGEETTTLPSIYQTSDPADSGATSDPSGETSKSADVTSEIVEYETVDETVYITVENVYLRTAPVVSESTIAGYGTLGESYRRVKKSASWSVVLLDGEEVYVSSDCVSTEKPGAVELTFNAIDKTVFVTADTLNLRNIPSVDGSSIIATASKDQALVAIGLSTDGKWYKINYTNAEGVETVLYASATYLTDYVVGSDFTAVNKTIRVTADSLNVRKAPSTDAEGVAVVTKDTIVTVIGVSSAGDWYKIKYTPANGTEGEYYLTASSKYVEDVVDSTTTEEGVATPEVSEPETTAADSETTTA